MSSTSQTNEVELSRTRMVSFSTQAVIIKLLETCRLFVHMNSNSHKLSGWRHNKPGTPIFLSLYINNTLSILSNAFSASRYATNVLFLSYIRFRRILVNVKICSSHERVLRNPFYSSTYIEFSSKY